MWHKYCYIVLSRDSIHSFFDSNCVYLKWTNMSRLCLNKKLTNATYLCRLTVPPSEEKWLERAQHYFNKKTLLVYAVFTGNNNIFRKSCSVALLFFAMLHWQEWYIPETWWSVPQENALLWHSVFIDFSGLGKRPKVETFHGS